MFGDNDASSMIFFTQKVLNAPKDFSIQKCYSERDMADSYRLDGVSNISESPYLSAWHTFNLKILWPEKPNSLTGCIKYVENLLLRWET